jgi:kumamolisin
VLACGGTTLQADPESGTISAETVWNSGASGGATGGGVSDTFPLPDWQSTAGVPDGGRGVPDVAAVADPATGYRVLVDGTSAVYGGTSAVAPLWAALIARLAQATGTRFGLLNAQLYQGVSPGAPVDGFRDITEGSNGAYSAGPGWDPCTGLGSPDGAALLARLQSAGA